MIDVVEIKRRLLLSFASCLRHTLLYPNQRFGQKGKAACTFVYAIIDSDY
ncbi:hypothetical protein HMPREF0476_0824 [Kingella kingae ATCC 23330]|uniref:Uncharacterized protein n=1 Tax=Kingella kingae ATCC 23330 TaxID=887327 RepID=F5S6J1_KINKI|nr:hypothetical protein HMPREF0476_0824 [Kingella kingae ATCC 23330]